MAVSPINIQYKVFEVLCVQALLVCVYVGLT